MGLRKGKSEARRNTHHARGRRKKKDVRMENIRRARRNIQTWFVRTTRKNGIGFFSRGGRVSKTCPFPDLRRFMENSCPLFRPLSVNNPPMMHLSSKLSMEIPSKLLSNLVQAALSFPSSPSSSILRIHLSTRMLIRDAVSMCHRSFVRQRVNLSRVKWKRKKGISLWE